MEATGPLVYLISAVTRQFVCVACCAALVWNVDLRASMGTLCEDWMAVHCCWPCAICQMAREMRIRPLFQVYKMHRSPPPLPAKDVLV
ncbi:PLAC8-like protein 1 isoform X3 [Pantherophis guttatus]|uniref:PLAC8-like protein 1 isoform X3 n=1 Tax=Pantherophis guttatus TaxID=94885 RepID=A0A6P9AUG9_PANGU|nr:PLAC8-like protein 1 isoform X3 [Pantherophis guttatus]